MKIQQFVMAYSVEHDRLQAIVPEGFTSLRPVLRINGEIRDDKTGYLEFNTPVSWDGKKGWLNIAYWEDVPFTCEGKTVTFRPDFLTISFTGVGIQGSCPAEKDNAGCYFLGDTMTLRPPEILTANKEFCDCEFAWHFSQDDAHGVSIRETLPAYPEEVTHTYDKVPLTPENAAAIPCRQVLGTYQVTFERA